MGLNTRSRIANNIAYSIGVTIAFAGGIAIGSYLTPQKMPSLPPTQTIINNYDVDRNGNLDVQEFHRFLEDHSLETRELSAQISEQR